MGFDQQDQAQFLKGLELAGQKQHEEALNVWSGIKLKGKTSFELEANIGKTYFELKNYPAAVKSFETAVFLNRFDSSAREDLKLAQAKIEKNFGSSFSHRSEWGATINSWIRFEEAFVLGLLALAVFLFLRLLKRAFKIQTRTLFFSALVSVFFFLISFVGHWGTQISRTTFDCALRTTPLESTDPQQVLPEGTRLRVIRESGNFFEVERVGAFRGWIEKNKIQPVYR